MSKIVYDVDDMAGAAQRLDECSSKLAKLKKQMDGTKGILAAGWKGNAADLFAEQYLEPLKDSIAVYKEMVDEFSDLLNQIIGMYKELTAQAEELKM